MLSYHNDPAVKDKYVARVRRHRELDNIIQGYGWQGGKGCAVGCTLESYNHSAYETELGIPEAWAELEDRIHEGLPLADAKQWPEQFLQAVPVGVGLVPAIWRTFARILRDVALPAVTVDEWGVRDAVGGVEALLIKKASGEDVGCDMRAARAAAQASSDAAGRAAAAAAAHAADAAHAAAHAADAAHAAAHAAYTTHAADAADAAHAAAHAAYASYCAARAARAAYAAYAAVNAAASAVDVSKQEAWKQIRDIALEELAR